MNPNFPAALALHLAESVRAARRRYRKRLERCQEKFSEDAVHELRIETRRMLALLGLLEALGFAADLKKLRKVFKKRLDAFDDLRDTHVQLVLLKPLWRDFSEAGEFKDLLCKCEKRLVSGLSSEIQATKQNRLNRRLKDIEKSLRKCENRQENKRDSGFVQTNLRIAYHRVLVLRRQIKRSHPSTIHKTRVAFKRFRYTMELLRPFLPHLTAEQLARMKEYQDAAGQIQDVSVLLARLDKEIAAGKLKAQCVEGLRKELLKQEHRAIDSFMERVDELKNFEPEFTTAFTHQPKTVSK